MFDEPFLRCISMEEDNSKSDGDGNFFIAIHSYVLGPLSALAYALACTVPLFVTFTSNNNKNGCPCFDSNLVLLFFFFLMFFKVWRASLNCRSQHPFTIVMWWSLHCPPWYHWVIASLFSIFSARLWWKRRNQLLEVLVFEVDLGVWTGSRGMIQTRFIPWFSIRSLAYTQLEAEAEDKQL